MRVIAGTAGGRRLYTPRTDIRPTMDRVKAAIFSSLGVHLAGARVLDLFAGSGSLGIEALSRGAGSAVFVESADAAVASIERNLATTKMAGTVFESDVFAYLDRRAQPEAFDLVFADPPYAKRPGERDFTPELMASQPLRHALAPGGIFVLEKLPHAKLPASSLWTVLRAKTYGATEVVFLQTS